MVQDMFHTMATICMNDASKCAGHGVVPTAMLRIRIIMSTAQRMMSSKFKTWAQSTEAKDSAKYT